MMLRDTRNIKLTIYISLSEMVLGGTRGPKDPFRHPDAISHGSTTCKAYGIGKAGFKFSRCCGKISDCALISLLEHRGKG